VLSQLKREGAPYIMTGMQPSPMDMRTMTTPYVDPQRGIFQAMARLYGLPCFGWGGVSDAKVVDGQAAAGSRLRGLVTGLGRLQGLGQIEASVLPALQIDPGRFQFQGVDLHGCLQQRPPVQHQQQSLDTGEGLAGGAGQLQPGQFQAAPQRR